MRGPIGDIAPGVHELRAQVTLNLFFRGLAVQVSTTSPFETTAEPSFSVRESVEQLQVTHAVPSAELELLDAVGNVVDSGVADYQGSSGLPRGRAG